jgi:hypothetical protein
MSETKEGVYVFVGTHDQFMYWCREFLEIASWKAERDFDAVCISSQHDLSKLWGLHAPMTLVTSDGDTVDPKLVSYISTVIEQENWLAELKSKESS